MNKVVAQEKKIPIVVNGDVVEFFAEDKKVVAQGNVSIDYEDVFLTADKLTFFTDKNIAIAEGNVCVVYKGSTLRGESISYDFKAKQGKVLKARITSAPFYGRGKEIEKVKEKFIISSGYITTCELEKPHYRIQARKIEIYPEDKVVARNVTFRVGKYPLFYLPTYVHPLDDKRPRVTVIPGKDKDWGIYLLTAWRYYFNESSRGRLHLDWREKKDFAWGIDYNYEAFFGKGLLKTYYMNERSIKSKHLWQTPRDTEEKERFKIQLYHRYKFSESTELNLEYHRFSDKDFLKDYFYREYEKNTQPSSYILLKSSHPNYTLSLLTEKRTNRFYTEKETLPEIKLQVNEQRLYKSPFYFKNDITFSNLTKKEASPSDEDSDVVRFDIYNQISLPKNISFLSLKPYLGLRNTYFSKDKNGDDISPRTAFYSGVDINSRFFRIFDVKTDFLNLDINRLRHIISPSLQYLYIHEPTISKDVLMQFDDIDAVTRENKITLSLENKLQTKRKNKSIDLLRFNVNTDYNFKPEGGSKFSDINFDLELLPYDWLRIESDASYDTQEYYFKTANLDVVATGETLSWAGGIRYERGASKQLTTELNYRLNPQWTFRTYQRWELAENVLKEQEYSIVKDLHCWIMELTYNIKKGEGESIWIILRLKAFPEIGFDFGTSYHRPKTQ